MDIQKMLQKQLGQEYNTFAFGGKPYSKGKQMSPGGYAGVDLGGMNASAGNPLSTAHIDPNAVPNGVDVAKGGGTPWGAITGAVGGLVNAFTPEQTSNDSGVAAADFDFDQKLTMSQAAKKDKKMGVANTVLGLAENIPGVGGIVAGLGKAIMPLVGNLLTPEATEEEKIADYSKVFQSEYQPAQAGKVASAYQEGAWSADGGYTESLMATGGPVEIGVGGTHEQNPNNGVAISPGNLAEEGEIVVDLPDGQFVFTNRF